MSGTFNSIHVQSTTYTVKYSCINSKAMNSKRMSLFWTEGHQQEAPHRTTVTALTPEVESIRTPRTLAVAVVQRTNFLVGGIGSSWLSLLLCTGRPGIGSRRVMPGLLLLLRRDEPDTLSFFDFWKHENKIMKTTRIWCGLLDAQIPVYRKYQ